jgi:hypothetical protein
VAAIEIGPDGVRVKPIVDLTKLMMGGVSAAIAIGMNLREARRFRMPWGR